MHNGIKYLLEHRVGIIPDSKNKTLSIEIYPDVFMEFVWIPPGKFFMGTLYNRIRSCDNPLHEVEITHGFWMGKYPVTQEQWRAIMGNNPSYFNDCSSKCPVEQVSWYDCQEFIQKINEYLWREKRQKGWSYRLPTEAEWEYACRAGKETTYYFGNNSFYLPNYAWYAYNSEYKTHPVGTKLSNTWGLYDMLGNISEWCWDWYAEDYYKYSPKKNPKGPAFGFGRIIRGGNWGSNARACRCGSRYGCDPNLRFRSVGFRLVKANW